MTTPAVPVVHNIAGLRKWFGHSSGHLRLAFQYTRIPGPLHRYAALAEGSLGVWRYVEVAMGATAADAAQALAERLVAAGYEPKP